MQHTSNEERKTSKRLLKKQIKNLQNHIKEETGFLEDELKYSDELRFKNLQVLAWFVAENRFLRSIITANSHKPIEAIMRDGESLIKASYKEIVEGEYQTVETVIDICQKYASI